jgi:Ca2+-binding EF-hand superfamily protein
MAAAVIAVRNARNRRNATPSKDVSKKRAEAAAQQRKFWEELERENKIVKIIKKYDKEGNGKLSKSELSVMLQDLAGGDAPTEEEASFVLHVADSTDNKVDGYIGKTELEAAIQIWRNYLSAKPEIESNFAKYDTNNSGKLEIGQLKALLTDLNEGIPPKDDEVEAIMEEADGIAGQKTGGINKTELTGAISLWYGHIEENQKCCTVM